MLAATTRQQQQSVPPNKKHSAVIMESSKIQDRNKKGLMEMAELKNSRKLYPLYQLTVGLERFWQKSTGHVTDMSSSSRCGLCLDSGFLRKETVPSKTKASHNGLVELCPYCPAAAIFGDRYQVVRQLGSGSFSQVFLVCDLFLDGVVRVVKLLHAGLAPIARAEAGWLNTLASIDDDGRIGVQRCYGTIQHGDHFGIVLEHLQPLLNRVNNSMNALRRMIVDITLLLRTLHTSPFSAIHADIKADNIMYSSEDERYRLIDFGNCTPLSQRNEYLETFEIQSLLYRAPEVLIGLDFGTGIDLWSLGIVVMQQLLPTHAPPFLGTSRHELLTQIAEVIGPFPNSFSNGKFFTCTIPLLTTFDHPPTFWQKWRKSNLARLLCVKDVQLIDLLSKILECDPAERFSANDILSHPFVAPLVPFLPPPEQTKDFDQDADIQFNSIVEGMFSQHYNR